MTTSSSTTASHDASLLIGCYTDDQGTDGVLATTPTSTGPGEVDARLVLRNASWLEHFGEHVLACSELPQSELVVLRRGADGLEVISRAATGGADACHLAVSPDERWVAVANYTSGQVTLFAAPVDGQLEAATALHTFTGSGPVAGRQESAHAHQVTWLDETHFLVSDLGSDMLRVMRVDDGQLEELSPVVLPAGHGPRHLVLRELSATEQLLAVGGELSGTVVGVRHEGIDWAEGWWVLGQEPGSQQVGSNQPSGLRLFGDDLVLANRGTDTVGLLRWYDNGTITLVAEGACGGRMPRDLVEHDGQVWVANQDSSEVTVLRCTGDDFELLGRTEVHQPARLLFDA